MRTMTSWADLIIWNFRHLPFHLKPPERSHPGVFFSIHEADWDIVHVRSTDKNELEIHKFEQKKRGKEDTRNV